MAETLPERFQFSRDVYGGTAETATRILLALTDGGHGIVPDDNLRWIAITAAQAIAADTADHDRQAAARALRDAADEVDLDPAITGGYSEHHNAEGAAETWLRARADRIEREGGGR